MSVRIINGDCLTVLPQLAAEGVQAHAVVCDPPYGLGFMGKKWDAADNVAFRPETWAAVMACMRPGAHLVAFGSTRTYHRLVCAIEDAGFEIRDTLSWIYGSGFPKSHDVSKGIDKAAGAVREVVGIRPWSNPKMDSGLGISGLRQSGGYSGEYVGDRVQVPITAPATPEAAAWTGWGTALKPAFEPIILARKPLIGTVAANVMAHGTGALNIDACRVGFAENDTTASASSAGLGAGYGSGRGTSIGCQIGGLIAPPHALGRWPANVLHDGSDEVEAAFAAFPTHTAGAARDKLVTTDYNASSYNMSGTVNMRRLGDDGGSPSRFFGTFKPTEDEWNASINANDAAKTLSLQSDHAVSALSHAVAASTPPSALLTESYQGQHTSVTPRELRTVCASVTALIQSIGQRCSQEWPQGKLTLSNDRVVCVAQRGPTDTTRITVSLWTLSGCADLAIFSITSELKGHGGLDLAGANRFHYCAKADASDRVGSKHPTVKPGALMRWLVQLVTPPGGLVLDPFAGTGSTGLAADQIGMDAILIEQDATYAEDARRKVASDGGMFSSVAVEDIRDTNPRSLFAEAE